MIAHQYRGLVLGVDMSAWIHRFLYRHSAAYLVDGEVWQTATLVQREVLRCRKSGITVIGVFDGSASRNKTEEDARRAVTRAHAMEQFQAAGHKKWLHKALWITWDLKRAVIHRA